MTLFAIPKTVKIRKQDYGFVARFDAVLSISPFSSVGSKATLRCTYTYSV